MMRDFNVWWPDSTNPQTTGFGLCYVGGGQRFTLGRWPDLEARIHAGSGCS
jgi:hypothetical protein